MRRLLGRRSRKSLAASLAAAIAVPCLVVGWSFLAPRLELPSFRQVRDSYRRSEAVLLDRNGAVIHESRVDSNARRLDWTELDAVSPALRDAVIRAEDRRFYRHHGIDWLALAGAAAGAFRSGNQRGASTITMQVVSLLRPELQPPTLHRSVRQKWLQLQAAWNLERKWSKREILESYLNLVSFRGELQGIAAAARGLFQKDPHGLTIEESIVLAALLRAPNSDSDRAARRARVLAQDLAPQSSGVAVEALARETLARPYRVNPQAALAPQAAARLLRPGSGARRIRSTLDGRLQEFATESLRRHVMALAVQNVHDGALLAVDNRSGDVLAYVGNTGDNPRAVFVDGTQARRQAGSTLKPFLYALALDRRLLTADTLIEDSPLDVPVMGGVYRPRNYDSQFHGSVSVRTALASSLNLPAVRTLNMLGVEPFVHLLANLGFGEMRDSEFYGPSLALGAADVTLWELTGAYRCLANGGVRSPMSLQPAASSGSPHRVLSPEAAFIVSDVLSDRESRSRTFSLESPLATRFWTGVKTGTSKDMRDNWCVGYSELYTVGVWTGNFAGDPMWNVSGMSGAAPVWVEVMNYLHRNTSSRPPKAPPGLRRYAGEWFVAGTETAAQPVPAEAEEMRIAYPADGTIIALDPDIPPGQQRVFFESHPSTPELRWVLNGEDLGPASSLLLWPPSRGSYRLSLVDGSQRVIDSVAFRVR